MKNKINIERKVTDGFYRHNESLVLSFCREAIEAYFESTKFCQSIIPQSLLLEVRSTNPRKRGWRLAKNGDRRKAYGIGFCKKHFSALPLHRAALRRFGKLWVRITPK